MIPCDLLEFKAELSISGSIRPGSEIFGKNSLKFLKGLLFALFYEMTDISRIELKASFCYRWIVKKKKFILLIKFYL